MKHSIELTDNEIQNYEDLIHHEDYQDNLKSFLLHTIDWNDKTVCEFGIGTGRITKYYVDMTRAVNAYDYSLLMLEKAKINLFDKKITFSRLNNFEIHTLQNQYDIVIAGWSFGNLVIEKKEEIYKWLRYFDSNLKRLAKEKVVLIETMGTNVNMPTIKDSSLKIMYAFLEQNGYTKNIIKTDYKFESYLEATNLMKRFYDNEIISNINSTQKIIIPEFTGVWVYMPSLENKMKTAKKKYLFNL